MYRCLFAAYYADIKSKPDSIRASYSCILQGAAACHVNMEEWTNHTSALALPCKSVSVWVYGRETTVGGVDFAPERL